MARFNRDQQVQPHGQQIQQTQVGAYPAYSSQFANSHQGNPTQHSARPSTFNRYGVSPSYRQTSPGSSISPASTSANTYYGGGGPSSTNHYVGDSPISPFQSINGSTSNGRNGLDHRIVHGRPESHSYQSNANLSRDHDYNRSHTFVPPNSGTSQHASSQHATSQHDIGSDTDYHQREYERRRMHNSESASSNLSSSSVVPNSQTHGYLGSDSPPPVGRSNMEAPPPRSSYPKPNTEYHPSINGQDVSLGEGEGSGGGGTQQQTGADRKISCLECRSSKVKCSGQAEGGCERCRRIKRQCVFEQHRRGRKPAQVKMHKLEQSVDTIMTALSALQEFKEKKEALREMAEELIDEQGSGERRTKKRRSDSDSTEAQSLHGKFAKSRTESGHSLKSDDQNDSSMSPRPSSLHRLHSGSMEPPSKQGPRSSMMVEEETMPLANKPDLLLTKPEGLQSEELEAEESQELGLPPLSNPLKLLAQASDSALDRSRVDTIAATPLKEEDGEVEEDRGTSSHGESQGVSGMNITLNEKKKNMRQRGASRRGYWALGLYSSRYDKGPSLDPISCKIMTTEVARDLYGFYMRHLNARITLLDANLSTFSYVRSHSALLLTSACAIAARFADHIENAEELANKLDAHIQEKVLPAVLLQGYRSVEISQAFIIMAAYHANTSSLDGDRSWSLLGYGIRIAAELDMNARMLSERQRFTKTAQTPASTQADTPSSAKLGEEDAQMSMEEVFQRKLRNRERTWCNLWLFENSLSTHMGRRSTLGQDPVILAVSAGWHRAQYAIPGDEAIVAIISLRRLQIKNVEFFEHSVLSDVSKLAESSKNSSNGPASASLKFQLEFYCKSCSADLNAWKAMYVEGEEGQSWRMKNARLYASYARLILNSYALKVTTDQELLEPIYKESYNSAMTYLTLFSERLHSPELVYVHNSAVVTVAYVAVFALRLCSLDPKRCPYINSGMVFDHVRELAKALARAGSVTLWRNGAASSYAPYLSAVLERVEKSIKEDVDQAYDPAASPLPPFSTQSGHQVEEEYNDSNLNDRRSRHPSLMPNGSVMRTGGMSNKSLSNSVENGIIGGAVNRSQQLSFDTSSIPKFTPEALSFMAGPSGVQASTVLDELTTEDLQFGQNFLQDQFMEGSLFSDMSVYLNAAISSHGDQQYPWSNSQDPALIH